MAILVATMSALRSGEGAIGAAPISTTIYKLFTAQQPAIKCSGEQQALEH